MLFLCKLFHKLLQQNYVHSDDENLFNIWLILHAYFWVYWHRFIFCAHNLALRGAVSMNNNFYPRSSFAHFFYRIGVIPYYLAYKVKVCFIMISIKMVFLRLVY